MEKCCGESVVAKCCGEVLWRSVVDGREVLWRSVVVKSCREVL